MAGIELYADREPRHRRTWSAAAVVLAIVFVFIGQFLSLFPVISVAQSMGIVMDMASLEQTLSANMSRWPIIAALLFGFLFTAALVFAWVWWFERRGLATIGFNHNGLKRFGRGFGLGLAFLAVVVCGIWAIGGYRVEGAGVWGALSPMAFLPILVLLFGFIIQGSTEEIVMRGWMMQVIASRHGIILAIVINAVVFSFLHAGNITPTPELALGLVNIVLVGVFFSLYAIKERSLWGVCGWHAAWNWLLGLGFGLDVSGQRIEAEALVTDLAPVESMPWWITGGAFGPEGSIVTTVVLSLGVGWLIWKGALKPTESYVIRSEATV